MPTQPAPPSPNHYQERRVAASTVKNLLEMLHEPLWGEVLDDWTSRYDGLERYLWPEEDPVMEVRDLLQRYLNAGESLEPARFASDLAGLRFCYCAARHEDGDERWDPFADGAFKTWARGQMVRVWDSPSPWPTQAMIEAWLLLRFSRARTTLN